MSSPAAAPTTKTTGGGSTSSAATAAAAGPAAGASAAAGATTHDSLRLYQCVLYGSIPAEDILALEELLYRLAKVSTIDLLLDLPRTPLPLLSAKLGERDVIQVYAQAFRQQERVYAPMQGRSRPYDDEVHAIRDVSDLRPDLIHLSNPTTYTLGDLNPSLTLSPVSHPDALGLETHGSSSIKTLFSPQIQLLRAPTFESQQAIERTGASVAFAEENSWRLVQYGRSSAVARATTLCRSIRSVPAAGNFQNFLTMLGYQFEYEFIQEGWRFQPEDGLEVRIYRVLPVPRHHDPAGAHSPDEFATSDHELSTSDPLISQILARTQASTAGASSTVSSAGAGAGAGAGTGTAAGTGAGAGPKPTLKNLPWIVELQAIAPEDAIPAAESRLAALADVVAPIVVQQIDLMSL